MTRRVLDLNRALALIGEWQSQSFATLIGFKLCLLAGFGFALYRGLTLLPIRLLVLLGLIYMALSHSRNAEMLGLLTPLFIAAPQTPQLGRGEGASKPQLLSSLVLVSALALASIGLSFALNYQPRAAVTPAGAVAALKASGARHVLNSYDFGGYLIFSGVKPFIDGRTELFGESFLLRHDRAVRLHDVGALFDLYDIDATLLAPDTPAVGLLDRLPGWKLYAAGDFHCLAGRHARPTLRRQAGGALATTWGTVMHAAALLSFAIRRNLAAAPAGGLQLRLTPREWLAVSLAGSIWMTYNVGYIVLLSFLPGLFSAHGLSLTQAGQLVSVLGWTLIGAVGRLFGGARRALRPDNRAGNVGVYFTWYYAGMAVLPGLAGLARDVTGSPAAPALFAAAMMGLALLGS